MNATLVGRVAAGIRPVGALPLADLLLVLAAALVVRLLTYSGAFGSDDTTYYERALDVAQGVWSSSDYHGALRYGFNLPAGAMLWLFGPSPFVASLWPLVASLIEVAAVWWIAGAVMGRRAGVYAALLLASAPLQISVATRIHADQVTAMFVTLGFVLLYFGIEQRRRWLLFAAGLSVGGIYWSKELAAVTWVAYLPMLWFFRGRWRDAAVVVAGTLLTMLLHGVLMAAIAGNPMQAVSAVLGGLSRGYMSGAPVHDSPSYYLYYLFVDIRHTDLLAMAACLSVALVPRWMRAQGLPLRGYAYTVMWLLAVLAVLSVLPISLSPLRFPMKQSNYITLFLAPLAVLAAMAMGAMPRWAARLLLAACVALGLLFGALQQADWRGFTANSKALAQVSKEKPNALWVGSTNNQNLGTLIARIEGRPTPWLSYREAQADPTGTRRRAEAASEVLAVLDPQTLGWYSGPRQVTEPLPCWRAWREVPPGELGFGNRLAGVMSTMAARLGHPAALRAAAGLEKLGMPRPALVYQVQGLDVWCGTS